MAAAHHPPNEPIVYSFESGDEIISNLASFVVHAQKEAIDKKGRFTIALSGGSLPKQLAGLINNPAVKWDQWYVMKR
jgi:6-phosphogluconolactonase